MRERLLELLRCPDCGGESFGMEVFRREGAVILEGLLACQGCGRGGPILDGIPRLLPGALREPVLARFPGFRRALPPPFTPRGPAGRMDALARTLRNYTEDNEAGWFRTDPATRRLYAQASDYMRHPSGLGEYAGKLGLDAGCGFGKDLDRIARGSGAEMVGADLSGRIDVAAQATADLPHVHLMQADLYTLPLRQGRFGFVLSLGMLHHLPDPALGFRSLLPLLAPGGMIQIWVYKRGGENLSVKAFQAVRSLTVSWPYASHRAMGYVAGTGQWLCCTLPVRLLEGLGLSRLARRIPFYENAPLGLRSVAMNWVDNFHVPVWHSHRREEIASWFEAVALARHELPDYGGEWMGHARGWANSR